MEPVPRRSKRPAVTPAIALRSGQEAASRPYHVTTEPNPHTALPCVQRAGRPRQLPADFAAGVTACSSGSTSKSVRNRSRSHQDLWPPALRVNASARRLAHLLPDSHPTASHRDLRRRLAEGRPHPRTLYGPRLHRTSTWSSAAAAPHFLQRGRRGEAVLADLPATSRLSPLAVASLSFLLYFCRELALPD